MLTPRDWIASFMLGMEAVENPKAGNIHVRVFGKSYDATSASDIPSQAAYMAGIQSAGYFKSVDFLEHARENLIPRL